MQNDILLDIVKAAINEEFVHEPCIKEEELIQKYSFLLEERACFITLKLDNKLRGCMGSLQAHRCLLKDLINNAKAAAFSDFRFASLTQEEFKNTSIEISLLNQAQLLVYKDKKDLKNKVRINTNVIIIKHKNKQATFLPQVWQELRNFDTFMERLCLKAGLSSACLNEGALIYTYEVEKIK